MPRAFYLENIMSGPSYREPALSGASSLETTTLLGGGGGAHIHRRISWGAIFGGVILVVVVQLLLSMLGAGIGLNTVNVNAGSTPDGSSFGIAAGLWWVASSCIALFIGGYATAWLSGNETQVRRRAQRPRDLGYRDPAGGLPSVVRDRRHRRRRSQRHRLDGVRSGSGIKSAAAPVANSLGVSPDMVQQQAKAYLNPTNTDPATMSPQDAQKEVAQNLATYMPGWCRRAGSQGADHRHHRRAEAR